MHRPPADAAQVPRRTYERVRQVGRVQHGAREELGVWTLGRLFDGLRKEPVTRAAVGKSVARRTDKRMAGDRLKEMLVVCLGEVIDLREVLPLPQTRSMR